MDILKLKTFYQVAKLGSLTEASKQLRYSIPNISRQITSLEEELNVSLFDRKGHKLHLTLQGQLLYHKATHILVEIESIKDLLRDDNTTPAGLLRISTTHTLATLWLTEYLKGFLEKYPHMQLAIVAEDEAVDVALRECDIAIRPRIPSTPDLIQTHLITGKLGLYAHKNYLEEFGTPSTLDDLDHHRLIARGSVGCLPYNIINWPITAGKPDNEPRTPFLQINTLSTAVELTMQGMGISALYHIIKEVKEGKLEPVLSHIEGPKFEVVYIYPRNLENSKRITCLRDYLLEHIARDHKNT
jgi:DNA-binding transcriptional LysR family regulator